MSKKKILFTTLIAIAGYVGFRRYQSGQEERDLWAEATDSVPPAGTADGTRQTDATG